MKRNIILKIKRKENKYYLFLYNTAKYLLSFNLPSIKIIHRPLYSFDYSFRFFLNRILEIFWYVPLFKSRCEKVGKNLRLPNGIPYIMGNNLKIFLADNVTIFRTTIGASKNYDEPKLFVGNNSTIGFGTSISIAKQIEIGDNCLIGPNCVIMDNDDHPINPKRRILKEGVHESEISPITIGDNVWIGAYSVILKGVNIGNNSVIATHSVITKNVDKNCVYAGYPARPTMRDIDLL